MHGHGGPWPGGRASGQPLRNIPALGNPVCAVLSSLCNSHCAGTLAKNARVLPALIRGASRIPSTPTPPTHTHATFFLVACPAVSYADIIRVTATAPMLLYGLEVGTFGPGVKLDQTITFRIGVYSGDSLYSPIKWGGVTIPGNTYVRDSRSVGFYRHSFSRTLLLNTGARGRGGGGGGGGGRRQAASVPTALAR